MKIFGKNGKVIDVEKQQRREKAKTVAKKAGVIAITGVLSGVCMGFGTVIGKEIGERVIEEVDNLKA